MENLTGSVVAIITPFNADGNVDYIAYQELVSLHLQNGTNGIVVAGTTGEGCTLTDNEFEKLLHLTVKLVNKRIPVIAGTGTNITSKTIHLNEIARRCGADGLLILNPYYNKPTEAHLYRHFSDIAKKTPLPIILYNVPGRTGYNMPVSLIIRLANEFKNISSIKDASGNLQHVMEIIQQRPKGFKVYSGDDAFAFPIISLGGDGCISVVANQIPREFSRLVNAALAGDYTLAREYHYRYLDLMTANFCETNPIPVKTALFLMGKVQNVFRAPLYELDDKQKIAQLQSILLKHGLLSPARQFSQVIEEHSII